MTKKLDSFNEKLDSFNEKQESLENDIDSIKSQLQDHHEEQKAQIDSILELIKQDRAEKEQRRALK